MKSRAALLLEYSVQTLLRQSIDQDHSSALWSHLTQSFISTKSPSSSGPTSSTSTTRKTCQRRGSCSSRSHWCYLSSRWTTSLTAWMTWLSSSWKTPQFREKFLTTQLSRPFIRRKWLRWTGTNRNWELKLGSPIQLSLTASKIDWTPTTKLQT